MKNSFKNPLDYHKSGHMFWKTMFFLNLAVTIPLLLLYGSREHGHQQAVVDRVSLYAPLHK